MSTFSTRYKIPFYYPDIGWRWEWITAATGNVYEAAVTQAMATGATAYDCGQRQLRDGLGPGEIHI